MLLFAEQRSLEDPNISLLQWPEASTGLMTDSGQRIGREKALTYSPVWRAVNLIASTVGKIPCVIYKRVDAGKERFTEHPAYKLLRYTPNEEETSMSFFRRQMAFVLLEPGNAYAWIERDNRARPLALIPLDPKKVTPVRRNGELWYLLDDGGELPRKIRGEDILHYKGMGFDGLTGLSPLQYARNSIGQGVAAQKYSNVYFQNSAEPRVVLEYPAWMKADQVKTTKEAWNKMHQGVDKAHRTAILQGGMKANPLSISARDSQLIETLEWSVRDVANWFGIPAHKIGDNSKSAYNSLEQENQSFLDDTIDAWFVEVELENRRKLLTEQEQAQDSAVIEFMRAALVRANLQVRGEYYSKATGGAAHLTVNEVRAMENLNKKDGYDDLLQPANLFGAEGEPNTDGERAALNLLAETRAAMVKRFLFNHERKAKHIDSPADRFVIVEAEHRDVIKSRLSGAVAIVAALQGKNEQQLLESEYKLVIKTAKEQL